MPPWWRGFFNLTVTIFNQIYMESCNVRSNIYLSGDIRSGRDFVSDSHTVNAFARNVRPLHSRAYLPSWCGSPSLTDNSPRLQDQVSDIVATVKVGNKKEARKPIKGLIDNKQIARRKDVNGSCGAGKWHEYNGPKSISPSAGCRSFNFHKYKGVC